MRIAVLGLLLSACTGSDGLVTSDPVVDLAELPDSATVQVRPSQPATCPDCEFGFPLPDLGSID